MCNCLCADFICWQNYSKAEGVFYGFEKIASISFLYWERLIKRLRLVPVSCCVLIVPTLSTKQSKYMDVCVCVAEFCRVSMTANQWWRRKRSSLFYRFSSIVQSNMFKNTWILSPLSVFGKTKWRSHLASSAIPGLIVDLGQENSF